MAPRLAKRYLTTAVYLILATFQAGAQYPGEAARSQQEDQAAVRPPRVYTNDDFPSGNAIPPALPPSALVAWHHVSAPPAPHTIKAETPNGFGVDLAPDETTDLVFMASWCPHCRALLRVLDDSRALPYWSGKKLVFLFSKNEWTHARRELQDDAKRGTIPESDIPSRLDDLKREAGSTYVTDPDLFAQLPGAYYFCDRPREVTTYPTVLSLHGYANSRDWLTRHLQMPDDLYQSLRAEYDSRSSTRLLPAWGYGGIPRHTVNPAQHATSNTNPGANPVPVAGPGPSNTMKKRSSKPGTD